MTKDEALKLALEALECWQRNVDCNEPMSKILGAIKEALAQPVQPEQEPVAESFMVSLYNRGYKDGHHDTVEGQYVDIHRQDMDTYHSDIVAERLEDAGYHTTPPQRPWVGLTGEERNEIWKKEVGWGDPSHDDEDLMKAIEQALKAKNT